MNTITSYCIGMDVDKTTFKACLVARLTTGQVAVKASRTFSNKENGINELIGWLEKNIKQKDLHTSFVMEATGVYHEHLAYSLYEKGMCVHIVLASKAKKYMQSLGFRSKNDKSDAQGLATMGVQQHLEQWKPLSKQFYALRSITRQVEVLQNTKTQFNNQLEAATHSVFVDDSVVKTLRALIKTMDKEIKSCQQRVGKIILKDKVLNEKYLLYSNLKGFGLMTFAVIVAETAGFELFKSQSQLVCYAGYDIVENQSGNRVGKTRISKKGNAHIRRVLFMPAFNMVKYDIPGFKALHTRVYERTRLKMKGYVAVQRKLLCLVYAIWKKNEAFDIAYDSTNALLTQQVMA